MPIYYLLLCGIFLPGIFGVTEWGFRNYTKYEPGDMNLILTVPHGGWLNPSRQSNGKEWPDRKNGCEGSDGQCIWTHTCGAASEKCYADIFFDEYTIEIARDIAEGIKTITGALNGVKMLTYAQLSFSLTDMHDKRARRLGEKCSNECVFFIYHITTPMRHDFSCRSVVKAFAMLLLRRRSWFRLRPGDHNCFLSTNCCLIS